MYSSFYYKSNAKESLRGCYTAAVFGALIYLIPVYILYLADVLFTRTDVGYGIAGSILDIIFRLFVINIFAVGYTRFLIGLKNHNTTDSDRPRHYDYNLVLSGFTLNFKNTLKITLLKEMYLLCWALLALTPLLFLGGFIAYSAVTADTISQVYSLILQLAESPTFDMVNNLVGFIEQNCPYLPIVTLAASAASAALSIPLIMKTYEYSLIPMIIAENPNLNTQEVFKRTKQMMTGFKWKYFCLQLSFIGYGMLVSLVLMFTMSAPLYYLAYALLMPYMNMSFIHFYELRRASLPSQVIDITEYETENVDL